MNKKKKTVNRKHYKTRIRLKSLNDLSLKKMSKKKPVVEKVDTDLVKNIETTKDENQVKEKAAAKKTTKKTAETKKTAVKRSTTKKAKK